MLMGMAAGVPMIDLDRALPPVPAARRPLRLRLAAARPIVTLAVLALTLACLTASASRSARLTPVLRAGGHAASAFVLGPDALYLSQFGPNPNTEAVMHAYRLTDGVEMWSGGVSQNVQNLVVDASAHVLMGRSGQDPQVIFLDANSGDELWRNFEPNSSVVTMTDGAVLIRTDLSADASALRLVDARTGRLIWRRTVPFIAQLGPDDLYERSAVDRIVTVGAGGRTTVLRWADGAVLSAGDLDVRLSGQQDPAALDFTVVSLVGERIYVAGRYGGRPTLTAYSTSPTARLWRIDIRIPGAVHDCGRVLCLTDEERLTGLDPASGRQLWIDPELGFAYRWDARTLFAYGREESPHGVLLDPASGQIRRRFGPVLEMGHLLLRQDVNDAGVTWVDELDPAGWAARTVGWLDTEVPFGCSVLGRYLACPTTAGPTGVWRAP
jgi:outer membrane protein assembly factor BamB